MLVRISTAARELGVNPETLRRWEVQGKISLSTVCHLVFADAVAIDSSCAAIYWF